MGTSRQACTKSEVEPRAPVAARTRRSRRGLNGMKRIFRLSFQDCRSVTTRPPEYSHDSRGDLSNCWPSAALPPRPRLRWADAAGHLHGVGRGAVDFCYPPAASFQVDRRQPDVTISLPGAEGI